VKLWVADAVCQAHRGFSNFAKTSHLLGRLF
jgi:hypothetical protein